jgi:hypothetical protein
MIGKSSSIAMLNLPGPMVWNHPWFHIGQASNHRMKVTRGSTFFGIDAICAVYLSKRDELTNHRRTPVGFDYRPWSLRSRWSTNVQCLPCLLCFTSILGGYIRIDLCTSAKVMHLGSFHGVRCLCHGTLSSQGAARRLHGLHPLRI